MKEGGIGFWLLGLIMCGVALFGMDTTVSTVATYTYGVGATPGGDTYNLGLLRNQILVFIAGSALFVAGVAMHAIHVAGDMILKGIAAGRDGGEVAEPVPLPPVAEATPTYEPGPAVVYPDNPHAKAFYFVILVLAIGLLAIGFLASGPSKPARAIENNAESMAANLEAEADRISADADNALKAAQ